MLPQNHRREARSVAQQLRFTVAFFHQQFAQRLYLGYMIQRPDLYPVVTRRLAGGHLHFLVGGQYQLRAQAPGQFQTLERRHLEEIGFPLRRIPTLC